MNPENSSSLKQTIPFAIVAISFIVLLVWLLKAVTTLQALPQPKAAVLPAIDNTTLNQFLAWQSKMVDDKRAASKSTEQKLESYLTQNNPTLDTNVEKAKKSETLLQDLVTELLELSKTDASAQSIVDKYGIKKDNSSSSSAPGK